MKHFISFQKRKALYIPDGGNGKSNANLATQVQAELFKYGFVMSQELFNRIASQSDDVTTEIYSDLCTGLHEVVGTDGYEPIYRNFPQSVKNMDYLEFLINALQHYWSFGTWRPEDAGYMDREFKLEAVNYKEIGLLTESGFDSIFTDIIYSGSSISKWDKTIIDWFIDNRNVDIEFGKITFNETKAYIGKRYLESGKVLPVKSATTVLRIYAAYCNGDEGLKENTKFKQPKGSVKNVLLRTLNECYDLEESFKSYREIWLRMLFYLNPGTNANRAKFPIVSEFAQKLRNSPKKLRTFNSYYEEYVADKNPDVFDLLAKRKGVFMRRINQLFGVFGMTAIDKFVELNPAFDQLITVYNYFSDRAESKDRAVVLANQSKSDVTTFGALEALHPKTVAQIQAKLMIAIENRINVTDKKVYIDRSLYYSPLALNNRASSFSLPANAIGKVEKLDPDMVTRCYVHWCGKSDIDLSAFVIQNDNQIVKVGWNGQHKFGNSIIYSGDNTGYSSKNAEYLDIAISELNGVDWVIVDAKVYRGPTYAKWTGEGVHVGWMSRKYPEANSHWLPDTISNAMKLQSATISAYLMAIHVPTANLVYLDVVQSNETIITNANDAIKMRTFLEKFVILDKGSDEIDWKKLAQGHVLNLLSKTVVDRPELADVIFDENTTWENISRILTDEKL